MQDRELVGRYMNRWYINQPPEAIRGIVRIVASCTADNNPYCVFDRDTLVGSYKTLPDAEKACAESSLFLTLMWFK